MRAISVLAVVYATAGVFALRPQPTPPFGMYRGTTTNRCFDIDVNLFFDVSESGEPVVDVLAEMYNVRDEQVHGKARALTIPRVPYLLKHDNEIELDVKGDSSTLLMKTDNNCLEAALDNAKFVYAPATDQVEMSLQNFCGEGGALPTTRLIHDLNNDRDLVDAPLLRLPSPASGRQHDGEVPDTAPVDGTLLDGRLPSGLFIDEAHATRVIFTPKALYPQDPDSPTEYGVTRSRLVGVVTADVYSQTCGTCGSCPLEFLSIDVDVDAAGNLFPPKTFCQTILDITKNCKGTPPSLDGKWSFGTMPFLMYFDRLSEEVTLHDNRLQLLLELKKTPKSTTNRPAYGGALDWLPEIMSVSESSFDRDAEEEKAVGYVNEENFGRATQEQDPLPELRDADKVVPSERRDVSDAVL